MVHGKNRIPYRIARRLTGLADLNMMPPSRLGCPLSLKTPNMGNTGLYGSRVRGDRGKNERRYDRSAQPQLPGIP